MTTKFSALGRGIVAPSGTLRAPRHPLAGVVAGLFFVAGGLMFSVLGIRDGTKSLSFSFNTGETEGRVVAWHNSVSSRGAKLWHPVVRYSVDGREFTVTGEVGGTAQDYSFGDAVRVLYRSAQPQVAQLNEFSERWFGPLIAGGLGLLLVAMGGKLGWSSFRDWRRPANEMASGVTR